MSRALITGITGQDGTYLKQILCDEGYEVHGTVHPGSNASHGDDLVESDHVTLHSADMSAPGELRAIINAVEPDEIYNLAAISSVYRSWQEPLETASVNAIAVAELLAAAWDLHERAGNPVRVVQASSAELFGDPAVTPQNEKTPIQPTSPYGASKAYAHHLVGVYRKRGLAASSAILYNHESPLRPETFVTRKITAGAARISLGLQDTIELGTLDVHRDWGWAPDYAQALRLVAAHGPDDFVIATGTAHSLTDFLTIAFAHVGISEWQPHVRISSEFARPVDPVRQVGDATKALQLLDWQPTKSFPDIVRAMVDHDLAIYAGHSPESGGSA